METPACRMTLTITDLAMKYFKTLLPVLTIKHQVIKYYALRRIIICTAMNLNDFLAFGLHHDEVYHLISKLYDHFSEYHQVQVSALDY